MDTTVETAELVRRASTGNQSACAELIRRHQRQVSSTIYGILGICPEAEDIGQETFLRFFSSLSSFRGEASPSTYITRIAVNLCINEIRKRQRHRLFHPGTAAENLDNLPGTDISATVSLEQIAVHNALQRLSSKHRAVLVLRYISGYSTAETAAILSLPTGTVLSRLSRAQEQIRRILDPEKKEKPYEPKEKIKILV